MGNSPSTDQEDLHQRTQYQGSTTSTSSASHSVAGSNSLNSGSQSQQRAQRSPARPSPTKRKHNMRNFPGSALLESTLCGSIDVTEDHTSEHIINEKRIWKRVDALCGSNERPSFDANADDNSIQSSSYDDDSRQQRYGSRNRNNNKDQPANPTSALFARALVSEVTDNPKTMTPAAMAEREKKLLRAQEAAKRNQKMAPKDGPRPVGAPGGIGQPNLLGSIAHAMRGASSNNSITDNNSTANPPSSATVLPPNSLQENRAQQQQHNPQPLAEGKYSITIGLSLSRRHSTVGHPDTVTRQTAFDFNELQDRQYKYVSSTDSSGWRAGGGERGGDPLLQNTTSTNNTLHHSQEDTLSMGDEAFGGVTNTMTPQQQQQQIHKVAAPDTVHIPIIQIDAESPQAVDAIINALARGEVFIPHMAVLPEALSVNGISPPDLVVRFGCERNDDVPPDEWPNWCLEFMHNQLYEYFQNMGARWTKRPFSITLARKVRWKTVKHMNRYFAHAERVIDAWREKGPQNLDPQLSYIEGGATPEEVARPHGIYLLRNGVPTNYFAPNFDPPYTTKMTRSLLLNVLGKSWDKKRREWTMEPIPRLVTPSLLMAHMCGCNDPNTGGFMANEVTSVPLSSTKVLAPSVISSDPRVVDMDPYQKQMAVTNGTAPPTPVGVHTVTTRSTDSGSFEEEPKTRSRNNKNRERKQQQQHRQKDDVPHVQRSPHMHVPTLPPDAGFVTNPKQTSSQQQSQQQIEYSSFAHSQQSSPQEEKKTDEDRVPRRGDNRGEAPGKYHSFSGEGDVSPASSHDRHQDKYAAPRNKTQMKSPRMEDLVIAERERAAQMSVANSNTTVMHNNKMAAKLVKDAKQTIHNPPINNGGRSSPSGSSWTKKKNRERPFPEGRPGSTSQPSPSSGLSNSNSGVSLEYSMDEASAGGSAAYSYGPQVKMDRVAGANASGVRGNKLGAKAAPAASETLLLAETEDSDAQDSASSAPVPTDEELFAVGWAKALDPNSGNYYYFTLDRTKTVWENPLSIDTVGSGESAASSSQRSSLSGARRQYRAQPRVR